MTGTATRTIADGLAERMQGATFNEAEAAQLINMVKCRTRPERSDAYLLDVAQDLMPESAYIEWARAHLAKLDG